MSTCQGLSPPPPNPHRASSTNLRSAFTLHSLGRRRSSSFLQLSIPDQTAASLPPDVPVDPISTSSPPPSMLALFATRFVEWMHIQSKHPLPWSNPSSPRSSTDEFVLPLSASAQKTVFGDALSEKDPVKQDSSHSWRQGFPSVRNPRQPSCHMY